MKTKKTASDLAFLKAKAMLRKKHRQLTDFDPVPKYHPAMGPEFYKTREWRELRYKTLQTHDQHCRVCGQGREHGAILHVDHIKPRFKYPALELDPANMQILCADCNLGKGAS